MVNTQSLDVVYNPSTIRTVKRFLTLWNYEGSPRSGEALNLSAAARSRYEMFKKHTKDELRHRWDLMLEGKESSVSDSSLPCLRCTLNRIAGTVP